MAWNGRMHAYGKAREVRHRLLEELQPLAIELRRQVAQARQVPSWVGQARDEPFPHRITSQYNDGDRARSLLGGAGREVSEGHNHIDPEPDQLGRKLGKPFRLSLAIPGRDGNVLPLDIAQVAQTLLERLQRCIRSRRRIGATEPPNPV